MGKKVEGDKKAEFGRAREAVTNLLKAAAEGNVGALKECVTKQSAYDATDVLDVLKDMKDGNERRALHFSAQAGKLATVTHVLTVGLSQEDPEGTSLKELVDCPDIAGETALLVACNSPEPDRRAVLLVVRQLVEKGKADVNHASKTGSTALHHAVSVEDTELIAYLIEKGADPNAVSEMGTPLLIAVIKTRPDICKTLMAAEADPNVGAVDQGIPPPICCAASMGDESMLRALLEGGGSVSAVDPDGWTPLHAALDGGHRGCADILTQAGADPSVQAKDGRTAADMLNKLGNKADTTAAATDSSGATDATGIAADRPSLSPEQLQQVADLKNQGNTAMKAGEHVAAVAAYTAALDVDSYSAVLYNNRAAAYLKMNDPQRALADAQEAKRLAPLWVKAMYREG